MNKDTQLVFSVNWNLFKLNPKLYIIYCAIQLIWSATPFICAYIINILFSAMQISDSKEYFVWLFVYMTFYFLSVFLIKRAGIIDVLISFSAGRHIKNNIIETLINTKKNMASKKGEVIDILSYDVSSMQFMLLTQIDLLCQCVVILINLVVLFNLDSFLVLCIMVPIIGFSIGTWILSEKYKEKYSVERNSSIKFSQFILESISNKETLQFFGEEAVIKQRFSDICNERGKNRCKKQLLSLFMNSNFVLINNVGTLLVLILAIVEGSRQSLSVGEVTLFISFIGYSSSLLQLLNSAAYGIRAGEDSLSRIAYLFQCELSESVKKITGYNKAINNKYEEEIKHVSFMNFRMREEDSLHNFEWDLGDVIAIIGENGSGKSRFLKCILGFAPYEGIIEGISENTKVGYVSQEINLFNASIDENIAMYGKKENLESFMFQSNIQNIFDSRKDIVGVNGKELSEGERQRVAIARALYNSSGLVLLDDVFSKLDKDNRITIFNKLIDKNRIVVLTTNDPNIYEIANKVIYIEGQKINIVKNNRRCKD